MTAISLTKPEILSRLLEIHTARLTFDREEADLWARLQKTKRDAVRPIELTFGKNTIAWGNGQALAIRGKGYRFIKVLYDADGLRLDVTDIEKLVWQIKNKDKMIKQNTFVVYLHRLSEKLEKVAFPYRLLPIRGKGKTDITGARLCITVNCHKDPQNVIGN